jgi:hypothetical protein
MHMNLLDIQTLSKGTERQKQAFQVLQRLGVAELLKDHSPVIVGAIAIDVDTDETTLELVCSAENLETFSEDVNEYFRECENFELHHTVVRKQPTVTAKFTAYDFTIEVFAQGASVFTQPEVVLTLLGARLLAFAPKEAREKIRELMKRGQTYEQALAACFELTGDPLEELLKLAKMPDREILNIAHRLRFTLH